jgi:hypothetical protein
LKTTDDIFLMKHSLTSASVSNPVYVVSRTGGDRLSFGLGRYQDRGQFPLPVIVFLDLKLPLMSGHGAGWIGDSDSWRPAGRGADIVEQAVDVRRSPV